VLQVITSKQSAGNYSVASKLPYDEAYIHSNGYNFMRILGVDSDEVSVQFHTIFQTVTRLICIIAYDVRSF
jgi:hypothetical protein